MINLGKLKEIKDLRKVWPHEALDFTPWLAEEDNLTLLAGKKMADVNLDKWINIDEAAEYLGVKPGTIRGWIRNNKGVPAHKIGKQWKFKCSELDAWVKSGKSAIN